MASLVVQPKETGVRLARSEAQLAGSGDQPNETGVRRTPDVAFSGPAQTPVPTHLVVGGQGSSFAGLGSAQTGHWPNFPTTNSKPPLLAATGLGPNVPYAGLSPNVQNTGLTRNVPNAGFYQIRRFPPHRVLSQAQSPIWAPF